MTRLYHFSSAKYALDDLRSRRLKIAQFDDVNDPFELKCVNLSEDWQEVGFDQFKAGMASRAGFLCFSEQWDSVLQWSHYADRHKGICLGFDVSNIDTKFGRVEYRADKLPFPGTSQLDEQFMWKILRTKFDGWQYEKEWRVFTQLQEGVWNESAGRRLYFADFADELVLREVILGAENKNRAGEIQDALQGYGKRVRLFRVHLANSTFELRLAEDVTCSTIGDL
jgi:hypothetical protein